MKELVKYVMPIATKRINLHTRAHVPRRTELAVSTINMVSRKQNFNEILYYEIEILSSLKLGHHYLLPEIFKQVHILATGPSSAANQQP